MIKFHKTYKLSNSLKYVENSIRQGTISGDGLYTKRCQSFIKDLFGVSEILMTTSCTHALELALQSLNLKIGDEVIIPSFTYPSTANAILIAGGEVVYSEVEPKHLTLDPERIKEKITPKTVAIIVVHYGGICCDMDKIMAIAKAYKLMVIEDGAQSFLSTYKGKYAGTLGHMGCLSFHGTKDVVSGEGGALIINDPRFVRDCSEFRMKGTNHTAFNQGLVDYYEWTSKGSSYAPSDVLMALLYGQLELGREIVSIKQKIFAEYELYFDEKNYKSIVSYSSSSNQTICNGHLFYIIFEEASMANDFERAMKEADIMVYTHFVPLHESRMGQQFIRAINHFTTEKALGVRLLRLPIYPDLTEGEQEKILAEIARFFKGRL